MKFEFQIITEENSFAYQFQADTESMATVYMNKLAKQLFLVVRHLRRIG